MPISAPAPNPRPTRPRRPPPRSDPRPGRPWRGRLTVAPLPRRTWRRWADMLTMDPEARRE